MFKYPFCARCGELLYYPGKFVTEKTSCCNCYDYKLKPNGKVSRPFFYLNPNPKIIYMDFEYDMESKALYKVCEIEKKKEDILRSYYERGTSLSYRETDYRKMNQIKKEFKQACNDFFNNVVVNNPDFSPAVRERMLKDREWKANYEKEKEEKEQKKQKEQEEMRAKRRAEREPYETYYPQLASNPKPKCPTCGSTNVEKISTLNRAVSIGIVGLASDKIGKQFQCKNCGYKW
nr:MAG TPA: RNA polymerase II-like protein [Caudoviricetes sp.]